MPEPVIDPEFSHLIAPLMPEEYQQLEASLVKEGCRHALVCWDGILLDGHNRLEICKRLGLRYQVMGIKLADRLDAMIWIRRNQVARRNLTDDQRAANEVELLALEAKKSAQSKASRAAHAKHGTSCLEATVASKQERSRSMASSRSHVTEYKIRQAQAIKAASPKLFDKVASGEMTIVDVKRNLNAEKLIEQRQEIKEAKIPTGKFRTLVIDPPWPVGFINRDVRPNQQGIGYPTMTEAELSEFGRQVKDWCHDDCHVYLWATQSMLPMAFRLLEAWELQYSCTFVWAKNGGFQVPGQPQYDCEFCLFARKGSLKFLDTKNFFTVLRAKSGETGRKPNEFYDMVARVSPGPRIDVFSREKRDGWEQYGNEPAKFGGNQ